MHDRVGQATDRPDLRVSACDRRDTYPAHRTVALLAPGGELAQVKGIRVAGEAGVAGQKPGQRQPLLVGEHRLSDGGRDGRMAPHPIARASVHRATSDVSGDLDVDPVAERVEVDAEPLAGRD